MSKNLLLVAAGTYVLGLMGAFISILMNIWDLGPTEYVFGEAFVRALIWPYETYKLFF